ncbi:hypothetical protein [Sphingomonas adhaesiva]|uniref:Glycosyltransferase RgtA/B/C/D-like domain-containing protein n=2 Tax=Sphingomonas adhaesiva TaxID=28212 RepID=A0A2A4I457_9SPHN|nr:hypothetical protein [Sphingomonas adhaesiva]PCG13269.1 hypothetical protein COA07_15730 [Sphingomonas adhaesiva]
MTRMDATLTARPAPAASPARDVRAALLPATIVLGVIVLLAERLYTQTGLPLWLDETWTAVIAGQPTWPAFWRQAWLDCNPPLYYAVMKLWIPLAGTSNAALRAPSFAFLIAAALLPLAWRIGGLSRQARWTWAALLFFWWPGLFVTADARAYGLLLLVSTAQTIAYPRMMRAPSIAAALCWTALAALAILTHYYAATIGAVQGVLYLWVWRGRAVRTWPALAPLVPVAAVMAVHAPRLADYARPDVAWYPPVNIFRLLDFIAFPAGLQPFQMGVAAALGLALLWWAIRYRPDVARDEDAALDPALRWTAIAGVAGVALAIALAVVKPTLADRYLTPAAPAVLLGIVLCVRQVRGTHAAYAALATVYWLGATSPPALMQSLSERADYGYERGSDFLAAAHTDQLVFAWDHPATKIMATDSLDQIGGFFLRRGGEPVAVTPVVLAPGDRPSARLLAAATGQRPAILWLYDRAHMSVGDADDFALTRTPGWRCRHSRHGYTGVVACARSAQF